MPIILRVIFSTALLCFPLLAESSWMLTSEYESKDETNISVLHFEKGKQKQTFRPTNGPLGLVDNSEVKIKGKTYFITAWAQGARTVMFRIFNPDISNTPLCEKTSFGKNTKVRVKKGYLQILVFPNPNPVIEGKSTKPSWANCRKLS